MGEQFFSEKVLPCNYEAEAAVIGAAILSPVGRLICLQGLSDDDFYADKNRKLFGVIRELDEKGPVDLLVLTDALKAKGIYDEIGGLSYLTNTINACPAENHPEAWVAIVKDKARRRRLWKAVKGAVPLIEDEDKPIDEVQSEVESIVLSVREPVAEGIDIEEWASTVEVESAAVESGLEGRRRVYTGLRYVDERLKLWPKRISVIAGATSAGKSAVVANIARNSAKRGQRTYFWTGEMDRTELWERFCAAELGIDYESLQERRLTQVERDKITDYAKRIKGMPLIVRDQPMSVADIRSDCRYLAHTKGPIDLVVVDYSLLLNDFQTPESEDKRHIRLGVAVWHLIRLARELDCHVIMLHQLNRQNASRATARPRVSDLRDSSIIEQHAHNVALVYRPDRDESLSDEDREKYLKLMEFIIGKQRGGRVGSVWLTFDGDRQALYSLDKLQWPSGPPKPQQFGKGKG